MKARLLLVLLIIPALFVLPASAFAHAHLVRTDLAPNSHLRVSVGIVRFWFDEPLNGALSHVLVLDRQGRQVGVDTGVLSAGNDEELDVTVPTLPDGLYSVRWTSVSALDGHVLHGFYRFTVGGPGAVVPPSVPTVLAGTDDTSLDAAGIAGALARWLVLLATALWTGALALEVLVLEPAGSSAASMVRALAAIASRRAGVLIRIGLVATLIATAMELSVAAFAAGGDWSALISGAALSDEVGTQYGTYVGIRAALLVSTLLVVRYAGALAPPMPVVDRGRAKRMGLMYLPTPRGSAQSRPASRAPAALGLAYLLALAISGHAGALTQLTLTAVVFDWLHLIAMAVWVGGMAAIALTSVPARAYCAEMLDMLDRFLPAATLALIVAAVTGMFNAQVRLSGMDALTGTLYGRLLLVKLALIAAIVALTASRVFVTRPRLRAMLSEPGSHGVARLYASLVARLRLEPLLGGLILLCVALMGQATPHAPVFATTVVAATGDQEGEVAGGHIEAGNALGDLAVRLQVSPADAGQNQWAVTFTERGRAVIDGQVRIKLSMPAAPDLGATFVETTPAAGGYQGTGDLVQEGLWRADVLVRTHSDPEVVRDVPFIFLAGAEPAMLSAPATDTRYGPATLQLSSSPGAAATLAVRLRQSLHVRYLITMPDMGPQENDARAGTGGLYRGTIVPPMEGYMNLAVQVLEAGAWHTVRMTICQVDSALALHLLG